MGEGEPSSRKTCQESDAAMLIENDEFLNHDSGDGARDEEWIQDKFNRMPQFLKILFFACNKLCIWVRIHKYPEDITIV